MAAFSYHSHVPFALDFAYPFELSPPSALQQAGDLASASSYLPCYYPEFGAMDDVLPVDISTVNAGTSSISAITTAAAAATATATTPMWESSSSLDSGRTLASVDNNISSPSSSAQRRAAASTQRCLQKRKDRQRCNSESAQSKDSEAGGSRKLKKRSGVMKEAEERKAPLEPPTGYIHVRARRGEATDSHSLAERVRREKIREKMKMLQDLVPGCDKVVGKALLLEEIINYVQSLQNQVEFLSMKLASMDPTLYDFGFHFEDYMIQPERPENMPPGLPNVQRTSHIQPAAFADPTNSYPVHDNSVPFLRHGEGPGSFPQDHGTNFVMHVGDQRQCLLSQVEFNSMSLQ